MLHNLALLHQVPFLQEHEAGYGRVAAVEPVDSDEEEAEDEDVDNRTAIIRQHRDQQNQQFRPAAALRASYSVGKTHKQYLGFAGRRDSRVELRRAASLMLRCRFRSWCRSRRALEVTCVADRTPG
ncbi:hypothetical protein NDU88_005494 [Pleurodeles waltl]|uniref:Uncharacterized protein n=1 Tax=Pleurodeles waltl TaxID=8319 RepID=A0AAV7QI03_PLEWA|nr:hypothetical protein NDU88_005494 [Pleurodeles waltl]